jgi:hypothetical protein
MTLKSVFISFIFGILLSYKYYTWIKASPFELNDVVTFATFGMATFSKNGDWEFDSFEELTGNYSTDHYFNWDIGPRAPINITNKILIHKLEEFSLQGYGIEELILKGDKLEIWFKKLKSFHLK